ncbi:MAG: molybdenum cofactor guanylyltransferase [Novipirellula sp. JB048]
MNSSSAAVPRHSTPQPRLLGVVLCGGKSSRMGRDKAALMHPGGQTYLAHAIERLAALCDAVVVSGVSTVDHDRPTILDRVAHRGPASGVAAALEFASRHGFAACLVTPVDMPRLSELHLRSLQQAWHAEDRITVAESDVLEPLVGIYPIRFAASLQRLAESERRSLSRWLGSQDHRRVTLPAASCHNINTPEDLTDVYE